jgi:dCTP deaminase
MQLYDRDILQAIKDEEIGFVGTNEKYPFLYEKQVQPSSIDLRLGDIIVRFKESIASFDIKNKIVPEAHLNVEQYEEGQPIIINSGEILYGQIYEQMWIGDKYSARIEGRSRVARLGLAVHCTGSYINPGFCGAMSLQLINYNRFPITIYPYIGICQLVLFEISDVPLVKYSDRSRICNPYFDEKNASPSVLQAPTEDQLEKQSIAEYRMSQLVKDYYRDLQKDTSPRIKQKSEEKLMEQIAINNYNGLEGIRMRDNYSALQVGIQEPESGVNATITQHYNDPQFDSSKLLADLETLKSYLKKDNSGDEEIDILMGEVSRAAKAVRENNKQNVVQILRCVGSKLYDIAKVVGCPLIVTIIKKHLGI